MYVLHGKLKRLKFELRNFNKAQFGNISTKVADKRSELAEMQKAVLNSPADTNIIERERIISQELVGLLKAEESYYKQKSRVDWIKEGDQNTKFFQKMVAARQSRFSIRFLVDVARNKLTSFDQIANEVVGFF